MNVCHPLRISVQVFVLASMLSVPVALAADLSPQKTEAVPVFAQNWQMSATSELSYATFSGSRGYPYAGAPFANRGSGSQTYLEKSFTLSGNPSDAFKLEFLVKGGYVRSEQTTGNYYGSYTGPTDTVISATATYLGIDGVQPYLSINTNIPTGKRALFATGGRARLDPDLVAVPSFGEGLNFGPTIGVNVPINADLMLNFSGGLTFKQAYDREGPQIGTTYFQQYSRFAPGMGAALAASVTYATGPWKAQASLSYSSDSTTYIQYIASQRSGRRFSLSLSTSYELSKELALAFDGTASFGQANYTPRAAQPAPFLGPGGVITYLTGVLYQEASNSNSNVFQGKLSATYAVTTQWSLTPFVSLLYRDKNEYRISSNEFVPSKTRLSLGFTTKYAITDTISLTGRVEHIKSWEHGTANKFDPLLEYFAPGAGLQLGTSTPALTYYGWQVATGVNFNF